MEREREIPMMIRKYGPRSLAEKHREEIEKAIENVKRTAWEKWFRKEWHRAGARRKKRTRREGDWPGGKRQSREAFAQGDRERWRSRDSGRTKERPWEWKRRAALRKTMNASSPR